MPLLRACPVQFSAVILALAFGSAAALTIPTSMSAVPCGINGFGRIGRLVARIMVKNPATDLKLINSGASAEYMVRKQPAEHTCSRVT